MKIDRLLVPGIVFILVMAGCSRQQDKPASSRPAGNKIATASKLLATITDDEKPPQAIPGHGQGQLDPFQVTFSKSGKSVAYLVRAGDKISVVHNRSRGKEYAAVGNVVLSPDGRRWAYAAQVDGKWRMVVDGKEGRPYDVLLTPLFSPDCRHVAYQAKEGDKWYIIVDSRPNEGTRASYTTPEFSSDSARIAFVEAAASSKDMRLIVSDLMFGRQYVKKSIGYLLFSTNRDRTRIAAEQVVGNKLRIIDFSFSEPDAVHEGPLYDVIEKLTFGDDGASVCYCALKGRTRLLVLNGKEEILPPGRLPQLPVVRPDGKGAGVLLTFQNRFFLNQSFLNRKEKGKRYDEAADLVYSRDSRFFAYAARKGRKWFVVVNGNEGPKFDRIVSPLFSPDGRHLVYRARQSGRRFLVVSDMKGKTVRRHRNYDMVFQPVFTADGKTVVYGVRDGNELWWKAEKL